MKKEMPAKAHTEVEARWINLDAETILRQLRKIKAKKTGNFFFREWIFAYPEWFKDNRRIRVRTDGKKTWFTYKANPKWGIDSTQEVEVSTSSADDTVALLQAADIPLARYQEKKRQRFESKGIVFDMDFWPKIPMVLEIEASTEAKVRQGAKLLGIPWKDAVFVDQFWVHKTYFNIDLNVVADYRFGT